MSQSQESRRSSSTLSTRAYQYATKAPHTLQLSVDALLTYIPPDWIREPHSNQPATVELFCADILQSHIPRISVDHLKKLVPHVLRIPAEIDPTTKVLLPTTQVVLAYQLVTEKKAAISEAPNCSSPDGQLRDSPQLSSPGAPAGDAPTAVASVPTPRGFFHALLWIQKKIGWRRADQAPKEPTFVSSSFPQESQESNNSRTTHDQNSEDLVSPENSSTKSAFFASLPSFIPKPPPSPSASVSTPALPQGNLKSLSYPSVPPIESPNTTDPETAVLGKKHLITPLSQPLEPLSNESHLQTLLHTDERLSIHRVLDLCSQLPGIRDCILALGWEVVARSQQTDSLDPMKAGSQASSLIESVHEVSIKIGLGTVKAITLYSSEGPVSFLRDQDLCLLIRHSDPERGFVPGVREKLQLILAELNKSRVLVPPQALSPKTESMAEMAGHEKF